MCKIVSIPESGKIWRLCTDETLDVNQVEMVRRVPAELQYSMHQQAVTIFLRRVFFFQYSDCRGGTSLLTVT